MLRNAKTNFLRCIGYLSFTKDRIKLDSLPTLALALQQNCLNHYLLVSLLSNLVSLGTMRQCMNGQGKYVLVYKNSGEVLSKLKSRVFRATSLSTYDFSTLYTTLPHYLKKEKLLDLIERAFKQFYKNEGTLYLACNDKKACFTSTDHRAYKLWSSQNVCDALSYILDNIYIIFGNKLYR